MKNFVSLLFLCAFLASCVPEPADMVILSGKVVTVDQQFSIHEAVAVRDGEFIYVGNDRSAEKYIGDNTELIQLDGEMVLPGLIDAHAHLHSLGDKLANLNISDCLSFEEVV